MGRIGQQAVSQPGGQTSLALHSAGNAENGKGCGEHGHSPHADTQQHGAIENPQHPPFPPGHLLLHAEQPDQNIKAQTHKHHIPQVSAVHGYQPHGQHPGGNDTIERYNGMCAAGADTVPQPKEAEADRLRPCRIDNAAPTP